MEAMLDAMGYQSKSSNPFPDENPFQQMPWSSSAGSLTGGMPGMSPWSSLGGMPGMSPWSSLGGMPGMSPWSSLGGMPGMSPWSSLGGMPGMSPWSSLGGMPGMSSPWDYARPESWAGTGRAGGPAYPLPVTPDSPTRELDGLWMGQKGERLWFRNGWLRAYRDVSSDARAMVRRPYLFIGIPETKQVLRYEYSLRGEYLVLRDANGTTQMFRRYR
jgi:hypothetical protein